MCVKINNDKLFFNAFPFENSFYFILDLGLDMVRSTGNLSSISKGPIIFLLLTVST